MEITTKVTKCFSVRFQNLSDHYEPRTADFVIDNNLKKEFFDLVQNFRLIAIYTDNDVWHIKPSEDTAAEDLANHTSTWDIVLHKYLTTNNKS